VHSEVKHKFFTGVQNKFHFAITGKTVAKIIYQQVDSMKENMGLTIWKNSPNGRILICRREQTQRLQKTIWMKKKLNNWKGL